MGCTDPGTLAACLRGRDAATLVDAVGYPGAGVDLGPVVDGGTLPVDPADALVSGRLHPVPVLTGTNRDESTLQVWGMERSGMNCPEPPAPGQAPESCPLTDDQYREQVRTMFGDRAEEILTRYPSDDTRSASEALGAVWTDQAYAEPIYSAALAFARTVPTYVYEFADEDAPFFAEGPTPTFPTGAYHCAELPYLFDVDYAEALTPTQRRLSGEMVRAWSDFARTGRPGWPRLRDRAGYVRVLAGDGGSGTTDFAAEHSYDFWRSLRG